jgi:hypothetical protein
MAGKRQVSPAAGKQLQLMVGQAQGPAPSVAQRAAGGLGGSAGAVSQQPGEGTALAAGGNGEPASRLAGSGSGLGSGSRMAGGDMALKYRILMHLATSTTGEGMGSQHFTHHGQPCQPAACCI